MIKIAYAFILAVLLKASMVYADLPSLSSEVNHPPSAISTAQASESLRTSLLSFKKPLNPILSQGFPFTLPGIVSWKDNQWVGSDNLYNLKPNIHIILELVKGENKNFDINEEEVKAHIQEKLAKIGISSTLLPEANEPFLPLFHVLVLVDSIDQFYTASCSCRLFEPVILKRVSLEKGIIYQAITWEKQELITSPKKDFSDLLTKTLNGLTEAFVNRFLYFQKLKYKIQ
ncbi:MULTISPECIES: hypothetical protein [unclassified Neochlamydia]|uniref:hypothetical protein n=1 Tax=unclassified Neochlamydia TaxID=2643326 RepID=UPI0014089B36|nr:MULTISPECIES: hypothetical protein [unclassified Neochlamydia]MBS4166441.1 Uncharacterized protein [Neochlamydia sp. AcF65]MBS4169323.1 Uncharacterized protein [Neochlamydia sp. AcF95]NGY95658.1 hypothetical protein [Neochlamydia sp. AcF84]